MRRLRLIAEQDGIAFLLYKPSVFRPYAPMYGKAERPPYSSRLAHRLRMLIELIFAHCVVVYMQRDGKTVGHLAVSRGGTRIKMSTARDIVIGPIWVVPEHRGEGLGSGGIAAVLHSLGFDYRYAYEFIHKDNSASICAAEKNGFCVLCPCSEYGLLKTLHESDEGSILILRYDGGA